MIKPIILATKLPDDLSTINLEILRNNVSKNRKEKSLKFRFVEDSVRCLVGELLVRYGLTLAGDFYNKDILFDITETGKPYLKNLEQVFFNISHSGKWVLSGLHHCSIGIDIELIKYNRDLEIADRFFTEEECVWMRSHCKKDTIVESFHLLWVFKEAYIKAIGSGLSCPLNSFSVVSDGDGGYLLNPHDNSLPKMYIKEYKVDDQYKCGFCCEKYLFPEKIVYITIEGLLEKMNLIQSL